jgi:hypothetical protein
VPLLPTVARARPVEYRAPSGGCPERGQCLHLVKKYTTPVITALRMTHRNMYQ